jgi:predicted nuclease of predicted toxin-antitoxin system
VKFLVDAQLPRRLARLLQAAGHDARHTLDLPLQNRTPDNDVIGIAEQEDRVVISKDADFVHSHILYNRPPKLLLISTGNVTNKELDALFVAQLETLVSLFESHSFIELSRTALVVHK